MSQHGDAAGRVPPHDLDLEAAVLSAAMLDADARCDVLAAMTPDDCYSTANGRILEAVADLEAQSEPVDLVTVARWLRSRDRFEQVGGIAYLNQIADATPAVNHAGAHAQRVRRLAVRRRTIAVAQRIAAEGYGEVGDESAWVESALSRIEDVVDAGRAAAASVKLADAIRVTINEKQAAIERGAQLTGTPTGFERLDHLTSGLHDGETTIVGARSSMGKTSFVLDTIRNVSSLAAPNGDHTHAVIVFSLEMPCDQLAARLICAESDVDLMRWRSGKLTARDWSSVMAGAIKLGKRPVWIVDAAQQTVPEMLATTRKIARQWCTPETANGPARRIGLVAVDYLQLARGVLTASSDRNREQEVAEVSRGLKALAKDMRVPVMALAQVNRSTEDGKDKRPGLRNLRESGSIEQDADNILFLYREDYYEREKSRHTGQAEVIVAKQRNGPTGRVFVRWNASTASFQNLAANDYPEGEDGE